MIGFQLPLERHPIYQITNGQKYEPFIFQWQGNPFGMVLGIIKGLKFLSLDEAKELFLKLQEHPEKDLIDGLDFAFASDGVFDLITINARTKKVYGIWTGEPDWTLPEDWQTSRKCIAPTMMKFLQILLEHQLFYTRFYDSLIFHSKVPKKTYIL